MMDKDCKIVQDILPLYVDEICSEETRQYVSNHVGTCAECAEVLRKLKNVEVVQELKEEGESVVYNHAKKQRRTSAVIGMVVAGILMIPVLVCMIVNLATGHGLSWFFIVLASLLIVASITVVPLAVINHKGLYTLGSFVLSLILLFAVINIYAKGHWFFVASFATLFGLSIVFMPFVVQAIKSGFWSKHKALLVFLTYTVLFTLMMISIAANTGSFTFLVTAAPVCIVCWGYVWVMFAIIRYLKCSKLTRAGLAVIWSGFWAASANNIIYSLMGYSVVWHAFHPLKWNFETLSSNINWCIFIICLTIGLILVLCGIVNKKENKQ